jgi:cardiolipin synthase
VTLHPFIIYLEFGLHVAVACVILLRRGRKPAVATAWIVTVMAVPILGVLLYLLVGESRVGRRRARRHAEIVAKVDRPEVHLHQDPRSMSVDLAQEQRQLARLAASVSHGPVLGGNRVELSGDSADNIRRMVADIDAARRHVHLLTYIFLLDGAGREVAQALARAAQRGVATRLLVDAVGSKDFLRSETRALLERTGVQVTAALPVSLLRAVFARLDIRNHRKLLVVDGEVAWTGSQNIADAAFAPKARYAPWVDCVVRIEGPLARELQVVFVEDWSMERDEDLSAVLAIEPNFRDGGLAAQAVATGPNFGNEAMTSLVQAAVQLARSEIVLTTPYFVPDLPMQAALGVAARRGVTTRLVVPRRNDSWLVQRASRGLYEELLACGVRIHEFTGGLLHAKTIVVDRMLSVVTSANLDRRSFELNFEMGVLLYDEGFSERLRRLQQGYLDRSQEVDLTTWRQRAVGRRLLEGAAGLVSPLL